MSVGKRMLVWSIEATAGFDTAWAALGAGGLGAEGWACGQLPGPYWLSYRLETDGDYVTRRLVVDSRWHDGSASLELVREGGAWSVNGNVRRDLDDALDCDLAACPLTNTMPIRRHRLHEIAGDRVFTMAFVEVPSLDVVPSRQRYTHVAMSPGGGAIVRYASGSFESNLVVDAEGFVVEYPKLGRRVGGGPKDASD